MEKKLFDWESWDGDMEAAIFYDCTLKVKIADYEPGYRVHSIEIDTLSSRIKFYSKDGNVFFDRGIEYKILDQ